MTAQVDVLDKGFVRLEDRMGGDASVVRAARVSYGSSGKTPEDDAPPRRKRGRPGRR